MRLTFIPEDSVVIINGVATVVDLDLAQLEVPDGLHAIQQYEDGHVEVEWSDDRGGAMGNSVGIAGLPGGEKYLTTLQALHSGVLVEPTLEEDTL